MKKIYYVLFLLAFLFVDKAVRAQCVPTVTFTGATGDYVNNFTFGTTISNLNSGDAASDHTVYNQTQLVTPGLSYNFTIQSGSPTWNQSFGMWIDFNNDLTFNSTNEFVWSSPTATNTSANVVTASVLIPAGTTPGIKVMRICAKFSTAILGTESCGGFSFGEFEDYTVNVLSSGPSDPAVTFISQPAGNCFSAAQSFQVRVKNYGNAAINLATNPLTVTLNVNGPNGLATYDTVISTGTLAPSAGDSIVALFLNSFNNALNLYAGGTYTINSSLSIAGLPNGSLLNDSLSSPIVLVNYRPTAGPTYHLCQNASIPFGQGLSVSGCATPLSDSVTITFNVTPCIDNVGATGFGTSTGAPANCANQYACTFATGILPSLPVGAYFSAPAKLKITNISSAFPTECRFNLFGAIPDGPSLYSGCPTPYNVGAGDINVGGQTVGPNSNFTYNRNIPPAGISAMYTNLIPGDNVNIGYFELWNDAPTASDIAPNAGGSTVVTLTIYYQYVPPNFEWYDTPTGGSVLYNLSPFNPLSVPNSLVNNSSTPGTFVFYAACQGSSVCRVPDTLIISPAPNVFQTSISACEDLSSSNTAIIDLTTLNASVSGGQPYDSLYYYYDQATLSMVLPQNADTTGSIILYSKIFIGECAASDSVIVTVNSSPELALLSNSPIICAPNVGNVLDYINPFSFSPTGTDTLYYEDASCTIPYTNPYVLTTADSIYIVLTTNTSPACSDTVGLFMDVSTSSNLIVNQTNANVSSCSSTDPIPTNYNTFADGQTMNIFNSSDCKKVVRIHDIPNNVALGTVAVNEWIECPTPYYNGQPYLNRRFQITPTNQDSAEVCLYMLDDDIAQYNFDISNSAWPQIITPSLSNVCVSKVDNGDINDPNHTVTVIPSTDITVSYDAQYQVYTLCFPVSGFSYFYCHTCNPFLAALPVQWKTFTAKRVDQSSVLHWTTAQEKNNDYFTVERSKDGKHFEAISAPIPSKGSNGNSELELPYDYIDQIPYDGHNYYRIRQTDKDGNQSLTKVIDVYFGNETRVQVFPNPAQDDVMVNIQVQKATRATLQIIDATGRIVKSEQTNLIVGDNSIALDIHDLAHGIYQLKISNDKGLNHVETIRKN